MLKLDEPLGENTSPTNHSAALQIARFRGALDWMLAHPLWEDCLACSCSELEFKGQRQGIAQHRALRSLPIEHKVATLRHALAQGLPPPSHAEAKRLARLWGVTGYTARPDFQRPSAKQWNSLQAAVLVRLSNLYLTYKNAQSTLYAAYQQLPLSCTLDHCRRPNLREDACQEARLALLEAIDRIDPEQCFEAYARQWIKRRVLNFAMQESLPVKAPINLISKSLRKPDESNQSLQAALQQGIVQLDQPNANDSIFLTELRAEPESEPNVLATLADENGQIAAALLELTEKQREVIQLRFGLPPANTPQSLAQIAQHAGISRQQVFQRERRALFKLSEALAKIGSERRASFASASGA